jgi:CBS domain-containing protein
VEIFVQAKDVMTPNVVTVDESTSVREVAQILLKWRISAVPVTDTKGRLVGIVSEGDLMRRMESGTERPALVNLADSSASVVYTKAHGQLASDVMTREVTTIDEDASLADIAQLLEGRHIKRVPVLRQNKIVGIVSRANLLHGLATIEPVPATANDEQLRASIFNRLHNQSGIQLDSVNVTVVDHTAHLWGTARSQEQKDAIRVAVAETTGVTKVEDHLFVLPEIYRHWLTQNKLE